MSVPMTETPPTNPQADRAITPSALEGIGDAINASTELLADVSDTGERRRFRSFRTTEIMEITGLSRDKVMRWRNKNMENLASYKASTQPDAPSIPQHPLDLAEIHALMRDYKVLPSRPEGARALRMGVFSFKGGVTKSTTTLNLASYYAIHGWRVLIVDGDPQGSLSTVFGYHPETIDPDRTLLPALTLATDDADQAPLKPCSTHVHGLDILPATLDMIGADFEIAAAFTARTKASPRFYECVSRGLATVEDKYDIIFIDSAPSFSFLDDCVDVGG